MTHCSKQFPSAQHMCVLPISLYPCMKHSLQPSIYLYSNVLVSPHGVIPFSSAYISTPMSFYSCIKNSLQLSVYVSSDVLLFLHKHSFQLSISLHSDVLVTLHEAIPFSPMYVCTPMSFCSCMKQFHSAQDMSALQCPSIPRDTITSWSFSFSFPLNYSRL